MLELAVIRRYLQALEDMMHHKDPGSRQFANELMDTVVSHPIHEVFGPIENSPLHQLTPHERILRNLAKSR